MSNRSAAYAPYNLATRMRINGCIMREAFSKVNVDDWADT